MQKKLLTVAVASALALPAVALAQVTVYGTIDTGIRNISKLATPDKAAGSTDSVLDVANNTRTTNRWGLKGSEDLGGGLMANFALEGQYASDTGAGPLGAGLFQRQSWVGLSKGGNDVRLGRDYTVNFKSQGIYDPMSYTYTGITPSAGTNTAGVRSSNMVTAGFRFGAGGVRVDYAAGEALDNAAVTASGDRIGFMGDFAFGPVTLTGALSTAETGVVAGSTVDTTTTNFGGKYAMGAFTFRAGWSSTEVDTPGAKAESPMLLLGVQYAISPTMNGRVGYYDAKTEVAGANTGKTKTMIVAMDYMLSKRTILYVEFDRITRDTLANATPLLTLGARTDGSTGIGAGIMHAF